ncbi:hypothetical protein T492DRAFT_1130538, partial [Pavlovales sp. CCMP2436]
GRPRPGLFPHARASGRCQPLAAGGARAGNARGAFSTSRGAAPAPVWQARRHALHRPARRARRCRGNRLRPCRPRRPQRRPAAAIRAAEQSAVCCRADAPSACVGRRGREDGGHVPAAAVERRRNARCRFGRCGVRGGDWAGRLNLVVVLSSQSRTALLAPGGSISCTRGRGVPGSLVDILITACEIEHGMSMPMNLRLNSQAFAPEVLHHRVSCLSRFGDVTPDIIYRI